MKILVTNDDGINAPGLKALVDAFSKIGEVYVTAPEGQCSSNSHHLTIKGKIRYEEREVKGARKAYAIWGTPADCTHLGLLFLFKDQIDLVVSGINAGANASTDIIYSGTIAAAREAFIFHTPAIAVSLDSFTADDYSVAAEYAVKIAKVYMEEENKTDYFLNLNVPALKKEEIKGIKVCDLSGNKTYLDFYSFVKEDGVDYIEIGTSTILYDGPKDDPRVDVVALKQGYVAVSALGNEHIDISHAQDVGKIIEKL